ncbi:hypothetical protein [uncultured Lamprocystis sp.]|uniref:hypothetical protein n=1 Tax=uncultured Lamprocystis sp. TaxID=543132 RepID=UPI00345BA71B
MRSANRNRNRPSNRNDNLGFRLAQSARMPELPWSRPGGCVCGCPCAGFPVPDGSGGRIVCHGRRGAGLVGASRRFRVSFIARIAQRFLFPQEIPDDRSDHDPVP